jgi:hypothetical protein
MGLRCSLFGHDYGDAFVERDREERGNEVVVTERELTECARCGAEKVTSQNTEVRTLEADRDAGGSAPDLSAVERADAEADATADASPEPSAEPPADATPGDASQPSPDTTAGTESGAATHSNATPADESADSTGGAFTSASDAIEQAEAGTSQSAGADATQSSEPADPSDDAVIMDDGTDDGPGSEQWGEHSEPDPEQTPTPEPEPEPDDEEQEDVEFIGSSTETTQDAEPATEDATDDAAERPPADSAAPAADESPAPSTGQPADAGAEPEGQTGAPTEQTAASTEQSAAQAGDAGSQSHTQSVGQAGRSRGEWPDHDGEDEGFDATADSEADDASFQFGEDSGQEVVEPGEDAVEETQFTSVGPVDQSGTESLDYAIYCPECGFERDASGSSLRAGDICPECRRGYLAEDR